MDLVVPFEMEHGSQILKKDNLPVIHLISLAIVPYGSLFLNWPTCLSGVQSLIFPIMTMVAFGVRTPMQVTLLWPDPWPMSCFWFFVEKSSSSKLPSSNFVFCFFFFSLDQIWPLSIVDLVFLFASASLALCYIKKSISIKQRDG